jgi:hypothetical protein
MYPNCQVDFGIETHHIIPLSKGGIDDRRNYITLCKDHHRKSQLHSQFLVHDITLATWKYYFEAQYGNEEEPVTEKILPEKDLEPLNLLLSNLDLISDRIKNDNILNLEQKVKLANLANFVEGQILKLIE